MKFIFYREVDRGIQLWIVSFFWWLEKKILGAEPILRFPGRFYEGDLIWDFIYGRQVFINDKDYRIIEASYQWDYMNTTIIWAVDYRNSKHKKHLDESKHAYESRHTVEALEDKNKNVIVL